MISIIQSNRFGGWTPLSLSPALWLDASDASTFTYHSGSIVSQWNDLSGNGRHATQPTSGNAPSRSTTLNGLTTVDFDGVDNWMTCGDVLDLGTSSLTVYVVVKFDSVGPGIAHTTVGKYKVSTADGSWVITHESGALQAYYDAGTWTYAVSSSHSDTTGTLHGSIVDRTLGTITQRVDGVTNGTALFTPDSATARNITTHLYIGALRNSADNGFLTGYWLNGQIAEIVVYLSALNTEDRDTLESYLSTKWGIL